MKILELRGLKSVRVYQIYQQVLIALAIAPTSGAKSIEQFLCDFEVADIDAKRQMLTTACGLFNFEHDDIRAILDFALDENTGIELSQTVQGLSPDVIINAIVSVLIKCSDIKIFFWTGIKKNKSPIGQ